MDAPKPPKTPEKSASKAENDTAKGSKNRSAKKNANETAEEEFSSDDDLPLVEKKKGKQTRQEKPKRNLKRILSRRNHSVDSNNRDKSADRKSDASSTEPITKRKVAATTNRKSVNSKTTSQTNAAKLTASDKSGNDTQEESKPDNVKTVKRKRRNEFTDLSQTDQSENETKTGRPMRKTKEAAAIYMELIGQKLNLSDFDDDLSVDSFPELPNVKKTEQMENDMKANLGKEKRELTSTPKRGRPKREDTNSQPDERAETPQKSIANGHNEEKLKTEPQQQPTGPKTKLEKSFSDSDDEPLAAKVDRKPKSPKKERKVAASSENKDLNQENKMENKQETSLASNLNESKLLETSTKNISLQNVSMVTPVKNTSTTTEPTTKTKNTSSPPKSIDLNETEFKMPAESVKQLLSPPINVSPIKMPSTLRGNSSKEKTSVFNKELLASASGKNTSQSISAILADLMPSKEESGKIFGIASVTFSSKFRSNRYEMHTWKMWFNT